MSADELIFRGNVVLPDRILEAGEIGVRDGRIVSVRPLGSSIGGRELAVTTDGYLVPGFIDLHVHGGAGADFMDGTPEAVGRVLAAHLKHGTTGLLATTTAASHDQILATLAACRPLWSPRSDCDAGENRSLGENPARDKARLLGVHLYGPYFRAEGTGCHPRDPIRAPEAAEYEQYLAGGLVVTASVAPELPGSEPFVQSCLRHNVRTCAGHTYATFDQMAEAVSWGVRHVDHLFCAMSDKAKLRQERTYPMRGGVLEATLFFDELTTEVIADGKHLSADLLRLAHKLKGPDRLALVTDCNRALDMPDGEYRFGPLEGGERFVRHDDVGLTLDLRALASSVQGMDHMVRTFVELTGCPIWEAIRMASLTPAPISGFERELGSIEPGKRADLLVLSRDLRVQEVYLDGVRAA